jgi:hypothetical protein
MSFGEDPNEGWSSKGEVVHGKDGSRNSTTRQQSSVILDGSEHRRHQARVLSW